MGSRSGSAWTAGQVAKHLGIAESTLRSWHRRYGIGPQGAEPGRYRRYGEEDVARLRRMLDLIGRGMLASDAARTVQAGDSEPVTAERDVADVVAAARASDAERCRIVLDSVLNRRGVIGAWDEVCRPALAAIDADQRADPDCIDIEHGLSWAVLGGLHRTPRPPVAPGAMLVLLACAEEEHHSLPLAALNAALAACRMPARMLGAATPTASLVRAVRETRPGAVVLWSQRPDTAGTDVLQTLLATRARVYTGGPGWPAGPPAGVRHLESLPDAVDVLAGPPAGTPAPHRARSAKPGTDASAGAGPAPGEASVPGRPSSGTVSVFPASASPPSGSIGSLQ